MKFTRNEEDWGLQISIVRVQEEDWGLQFSTYQPHEEDWGLLC